MSSSELPEYFKCPISLDIMSDPVILSSGHTFDRLSIQRWFDSGHRTCPITKLPLPDPPPLIPNHALRSLISNYTPHPHPHPHPQFQPEPESESEPDSISLPSIITTLTSPKSTLDSKLDSLSQLTTLSKSNPTLLAESGALSAILRCVDSSESALQEKSLSLLLHLSLDDDNKVGLVAEGAVGKLIAAVYSAPTAAATAATVITSLAVVEVNKATIGAYPGAVRSLVHLLTTGRGRGRKEAATALFALCSFPENRRRAVDSGAVPILARMARSGIERAVEVIGLLSKCKEGRDEMVKVDGLVEVLVGFVRDGSSRGVQYGLLALNCLCNGNQNIIDQVRNEGVLEICFGLIDDDNEKIRRVALSLAQLLQENDPN